MTNNCKMAINAMDIIISHEVSAKYPTVRNSFYTSHEAASLRGGIEAWQGNDNNLPIEVCDVIPEQRYMRKLDKDLTEDMMNFARQNPNVRANKIHAGLNILNYKNNAYLKQFGMEISNEMTVVNARILPTPTIQYHQFLPDQVIRLFVRELIITCKDTGMAITEHEPPICRENPIGDTEGSLKKAWVMARDKARGVKPQLILCILPNEPTILMGADVTHPSPGDTESPSYAALCGSLNVKASRYAASLRVQRGESQFMEVLDSELTAIKAACHSLEANYKPTITFVVVQKRHHTRFFPIQGADRTGNCFPGTVVDRDITHPFEFDFYLLSHAGLLGTSRPTHYHVLYDQNGFDANKLQMLSYNLCYVFARCTRAVSLVPPVYYAHLAAFRARLHSPRSTDTESSEASEGGRSAATTFGAVREDLRKVMYFV
ncbi:unnamed protein product [Rhizophagus irregularis]|nr:unnamed protein product [Rhizophagus irregularis]